MFARDEKAGVAYQPEGNNTNKRPLQCCIAFSQVNNSRKTSEWWYSAALKPSMLG